MDTRTLKVANKIRQKVGTTIRDAAGSIKTFVKEETGMVRKPAYGRVTKGANKGTPITAGPAHKVLYKAYQPKMRLIADDNDSVLEANLHKLKRRK